MATKIKDYVHNLYIAESSAMVLKGVDDYLKIAREKIKRHPQFEKELTLACLQSGAVDS